MTMLPPDDRLQRILGGPHLALLRKRLRQRFERASVEGHVDSFRIDKLTPEEHTALASLQGRAPRFSPSMQVDVARIDEALRQAGVARSLHEALERLDGPIVHAASARARTAALWSAVTAGCTHDGLTVLTKTPSGIGLLKRLSHRDPRMASELLHLAEAVLQRLPANGLTRARLAADALGDAHALDSGQAVATLVLAAWRRIRPLTINGTENESAKESVEIETQELREEKARDIWARAGILVNELARPVLFLNLPMRETACHVFLAGEPSYLSLRALLRAPPCWNVAGRDVFVCENPNLLAIAADSLGSSCAPTVCTDGMPSAAQHLLLAQLIHAGAHLHYHGDFDWAGVHIGNHVIREYGAQPWRFGSDDYLSAVQAAPRRKYRLIGQEANASWDEALAPAMRRHQLPIPEEAVVSALLPDLQT
jgi:uncharacterized protein (TIGR02679 family)